MPGRDKGGQGTVYYTSTDSFTTLYSTKSSQSQFLFMPEFSSLSSLPLYSLEKSEKKQSDLADWPSPHPLFFNTADSVSSLLASRGSLRSD